MQLALLRETISFPVFIGAPAERTQPLAPDFDLYLTSFLRQLTSLVHSS